MTRTHFAQTHTHTTQTTPNTYTHSAKPTPLPPFAAVSPAIAAPYIVTYYTSKARDMCGVTRSFAFTLLPKRHGGTLIVLFLCVVVVVDAVVVVAAAACSDDVEINRFSAVG